jgi:hypothetical protein
MDRAFVLKALTLKLKLSLTDRESGIESRTFNRRYDFAAPE